MYSIIKNTVDSLVSFLLLIILLPIFIILSILIKIDSDGPVFFTQKRAGKNGKLFKIYKFRTMTQNSEKKAILTSKKDKRITKIGKFLRDKSLDELPQFFNVLKGEMSFIGPRPEIPELVRYYTKEQRKVLKIKPGITGLAQIEYGDKDLINFKGKDIEEFHKQVLIPEKLKYDLNYLKNISFLLDLKIISKTFMRVFFR